MTYTTFIKNFNERGYFTGKSGRKYYPKVDSVTVKKGPFWEKLILELAFGINFRKMVENYQRIHHLATSKMETNEVVGRLHEVGELVTEQMKGINNHQQNNYSTELALCAVFCVTDDEQNEISADIVKRKRDDWENIPEVFFSQLSNSIKNAYLKESRKTIEQVLGQKISLGQT